MKLTTYRLDRRFVLQAIGITLLLAGALLAVGMVVDNVWVILITWLGAVGLVIRAVVLWAKPPAVARLDDEGITIGGRLTVKPVPVSWSQVQNVALNDNRLVFDRGDEAALSFPLSFVGRQAPQFAREVYDRLNTANGYRRFDPNDA